MKSRLLPRRRSKLRPLLFLSGFQWLRRLLSHNLNHLLLNRLLLRLLKPKLPQAVRQLLLPLRLRLPPRLW